MLRCHGEQRRRMFESPRRMRNSKFPVARFCSLFSSFLFSLLFLDSDKKQILITVPTSKIEKKNVFFFLFLFSKIIMDYSIYLCLILLYVLYVFGGPYPPAFSHPNFLYINSSDIFTLIFILIMRPNKAHVKP